MVLLSAQGMDVAQIAEVAFTSPDRVREVLHNFNDDDFDSLYPYYDATTLAKVAERFRSDFETFGYNPNRIAGAPASP